jgi:hypothetical protein
MRAVDPTFTGHLDPLAATCSSRAATLSASWPRPHVTVAKGLGNRGRGVMESSGVTLPVGDNPASGNLNRLAVAMRCAQAGTYSPYDDQTPDK